MNQGIPFVGIGDLSKNTDSSFPNARTVSRSIFDEHAARYDLQEGLLGLGRVASVGLVVDLPIPDVDRPYVVSPTLAVIKAKSIDKSYLKYQLMSPQVQLQLDALKQGSGRESVGVQKLRNVLIHVPPLDEQRRIVETLDDHLSRLDASVADLDHADTQALMFRRSVLNTLLKPQVVDSEPDVEYPTSVSWKPFTLGDLGKWVTGSTPSSSDSTNKGEDVLFVTPGDIGTGGKLVEVARRISSLGADRVRRIKSGSVILVCIGTIGKVAWTDLEITTNQQINTLEVDQSRFDIRFVHWLLASPLLQEQLWQNSTSTTVALINKKTLEKIPCIIPSLDEQRRIVETLDDHLSRLDSTRKSIANQRLLLSTLRRSILNKAFNVELGTN
jgi:type I restriction enzyme S subunit